MCKEPFDPRHMDNQALQGFEKQKESMRGSGHFKVCIFFTLKSLGDFCTREVLSFPFAPSFKVICTATARPFDIPILFPKVQRCCTLARIRWTVPRKGAWGWQVGGNSAKVFSDNVGWSIDVSSLIHLILIDMSLLRIFLSSTLLSEQLLCVFVLIDY